MRVLQIIDSLSRSGGAEQALALTAPLLGQRGIDIEIAYLVNRHGLLDDLRAEGIPAHPLVSPARWSRVGLAIKLIRQRSPDLVHTTLFEADLTGRIAGACTHTPVVSSLVNVGYGPEHRNDPGLSAWKVRAAHAADVATARNVRRFHAISDHVARTMATRLRIRPDRVDVVPRGRDPRTLETRHPDQRRVVRDTLEIGEGTPLILAAARHEYQKGLDVLVEAMALVQAKFPQATLIIAGRFGLQTSLLQETARRCGVMHLHLLGAREDVPTLMGAADVFCAPSRWEGLGSAVIEAMGVGVPVVASDVPALREAVGSGACAHLVTPDDSRALGEAMIVTLRDKADTALRAATARRRFAERYTLDTVVDGMVAFYERALTSRLVSR